MALSTQAVEISSVPEPDEPDRLITAEELAQMSDIATAELVRGRIKRMTPTGHLHGRLEATLAGLLFVHLQQHKLGYLLTGEVGIFTERNPDTVRAADIAFISNERYASLQTGVYLDVCPELIVEVMSPRDTWSDVQEKLAEYFAAEAKLVWIIDPRLEQIHVFRSVDHITRLTKSDELSGGDVLPEFRVAVREIFETQ